MSAVPATPVIDKERCAQEPIHIPGSIQPHGVLFVLRESDLTISQVSANVETMLAIPAAALPGATMRAILGPDQAQALEVAIRRADPVATVNPMHFVLVTQGTPVDFECVVHQSGDSIVVELEPYATPLDTGGLDVAARVHAPMARMQATRELAELVKSAADEVRATSGFDRVMVYRFDEDWNGAVIAESTSEAAPVAYLGLRFPAGDIPEQARRLYLLNPLRLIADVGYAPAPLVPHTQAPVDLSRSVLRSVSPVHIEYLQNIGVRATLTISIIIDGRLWGLIACHHLTPRRLDYVTRASCEFFGQMLSWQLGSRIRSRGLQNSILASSLVDAYDRSLSEHDDLAAGLVAGAQNLLDLFGGQGFAVRVDGKLRRFGATPPDDDAVAHIAAALHRVARDGVAASHQVGELVPPGVHVDAAGSGALLITFGERGDEYLLCFRTEVIETIDWGGDIRTAVTESDGKLHPRTSFALWKQIVRGQSLRWSPSDIAGAHTLRERVLERMRAIEREAVEKRIRYLAHHDALTQLPNRASFGEMLARRISEAERDNTILAVLFIDLDHFKVFNDTFGHATGDRILQTAAARMRKCVRHNDVVARLGGDEFVIISPALSKISDADAIANKVLQAVGEPFFGPDGRELRFTASVGIALYPQDSSDAYALLGQADLAMYRAKEKGRNTFARFDVGDAAPTYERLTLERRIDEGLERNEFAPYYQPIVCARTGRLLAIEALARWMHPEKGMLPPSEFIAVAEASHSIVVLGKAMLRAACADAFRWRLLPGFDKLQVTVNVSARQFQAAGFLETVRAALADSHLPANGLQLELTESLLIGDERYALRTLRALRDLGVSIAIDDFGTGYSSLSYLTRLPVDALKIDQSFVRNLSARSEGTAIVRAIIAMAHSLKLSVIAEGVETDDQLGFLRSEGCDKIQGYLFARPLSHPDMSAFIRHFGARPVEPASAGAAA